MLFGMEEEKRLKMAAISGASRALRYKEENPRASEQEVIQHISDSLSDIIDRIDKTP